MNIQIVTSPSKLKSSSSQSWEAILNEAIEMMQYGSEPRSALKQCANDSGIEYGDDMQEFVNWAELQLQ